MSENKNKYCCPECQNMIAKYEEQAECQGVWAYCKKCGKEREIKIQSTGDNETIRINMAIATNVFREHSLKLCEICNGVYNRKLEKCPECFKK